MLHLQAAHVVVYLVDWVVQVSVDEYEVALRVLGISHLDHLTVSDSAEVQKLVRDERVCPKVASVGDHCVSVLVEVRVGALPDRLVLDLRRRQVLQVAATGGQVSHSREIMPFLTASFASDQLIE